MLDMTESITDRPSWVKPRIIRLTGSADAMAGSLCGPEGIVTRCGYEYAYQLPPSF